MDNSGYNTGSFDGLHPVSDDDDDDEMVDIAGATLDFSNTDDDPPLNSGEGLLGWGVGPRVHLRGVGRDPGSIWGPLMF